MNVEEFQLIRDTIPSQPGIYKYMDIEGNWLYVGKAKHLKKRVSQYFLENNIVHSRIKMMVKQIHSIEFTVVENENDALILENNLIKEFQPKYNIRLKDDKTYPFIVIKNERFPRVYFTRQYIKDGSEYLGPYTSVMFAKDIFNTIKQIFPLRNCHLALSEANINAHKFKPCLEYHIGNCLAPCVGLQSEADYSHNIKKIKDILKGKFNEIKEVMESQMEVSAKKMDFESAEKWKQKWMKLRDFETKSVIFNPKWSNILTVNIYETQNKKIINYLRLENGTIVATKSFEVESKTEVTNREILSHFVIKTLIEFPEIVEVVLPEEVEELTSGVRQVIPLVGDKKNLLELSYHNARSYAMTLFTDPKFERKRNEFNILKELQDRLHLTQLPIHIECFDNSNIQGTHPVAACVVFKNGKPSKKDYRHFHIKTVEGPDDFGSMKEIVARRYQRMIDEHEDLPQLIVIDGGKGQLSHAIEALESLGIQDKVAIVGIAKRLEEIYFKNDPLPLYIDKKSPALKLIQALRNEAHRFGITFHRSIRSKSMTSSVLDQIKGLGQTSIQKLYKHYHSVANIQLATMESLTEVIGAQRGKIVYDFFQSNS